MAGSAPTSGEAPAGRLLATLAAFALLAGSPPALAGEADAGQPAAEPSPAAAPASPSWDVGATLYAYVFPDGTGLLLPIAAVDHGGLHLEARYNYEARRAASAWVGWNLAWGDVVTFSLTPMVGGVFGDLNGLAAGLEWTLAWGPLELYAESEAVLDLGASASSYFYAWTELSARPVGWLRAGLALQRTRAVETKLEVQWGPLVGASFWKLEATAYWFNPGVADAQFWVAALGASF